MATAFQCVGTPVDEMRRLERLRERDPASAANVVANGALLVELARHGRLRELQTAIDHMTEDHVLMFYSVRMFRVACTERRIDVLRFMLSHGFNLQQVCLRDVLHGIVDTIENDQDADAAQPLLRFLIDSGVDVNWQRKGDLLTALHVACRKNLYGIAYLFILYGADVNAVAADDDMPLCSAERMDRLRSAPTAANLARKAQLVALLVDCGARRSWRKPKPQQQPQQQQSGMRSLSAGVARLSVSPAICSFVSATPASIASAGRLDRIQDKGIQLDTPTADLENWGLTGS